jgi:hypothetical protein
MPKFVGHYDFRRSSTSERIFVHRAHGSPDVARGTTRSPMDRHPRDDRPTFEARDPVGILSDHMNEVQRRDGRPLFLQSPCRDVRHLPAPPRLQDS